MGSRYSFHSHVPAEKFRHLLHGFVMDLDASKIAQVVKLNRNTVNRYFQLLRERIADEGRCECEAEVKTDGTSLFGVTVGHGAVRVHPLKLDGTALEAFDERLGPPSLYHADGLPFLGIIDMHAKRDYIMPDAPDRDARLVDAFVDFARQRLSRFRGIYPSAFFLHLKECEWRFNRRGEDLFHHLLANLREEPLRANP
jgi:transposase